MDGNQLTETIKTSMKSIKEIVETNTIIGEKIELSNNSSIIPVSKLCLSFGSGGRENKGYGRKDRKKNIIVDNEKKEAFIGGSGAKIEVEPICFIVSMPDGGINLISVNEKAPIGFITDILKNFRKSNKEN